MVYRLAALTKTSEAKELDGLVLHLPILENQAKNKHVESLVATCLDQGSTPCSSTKYFNKAC